MEMENPNDIIKSPKLRNQLHIDIHDEEVQVINGSGNFGWSKNFDYDGGFESLLVSQKNLEHQIRVLHREIVTLKKKLHIFEEETNRNSWGIRYARRMAIMSNLLLGIWVFWSRLVKHFQKQKKTSLLGVMVPPFKSMNRSISQSTSILNKLLYEGYMKAISKSWVFFAGALLLTRNVSWKRYAGLGLTTSYSLFLAISSNFLPWTNYFNIFSNLLYISASWTTNKALQASTLSDFIFEEPKPSVSQIFSPVLINSSSSSSLSTHKFHSRNSSLSSPFKHLEENQLYKKETQR